MIESIINKYTGLRKEQVAYNVSQYRMDENLPEYTGTDYRIYQNEGKRPESEKNAGLLKYSHLDSSSYGKQLNSEYGWEENGLLSYEVPDVNKLREYNSTEDGDYLSYISRVYGVSPTYAGTGIGVLNTLSSIQEFGNAFTVSSLSNTENKSFVDYINEIRQYQDVKYAMEINAPAIIKDIRVQEALDGVITTNRNNYGGEDTKLGTISNTLYAVNLMQGATFNSLRRTQYITSDTENLYGNNLNNVYNLSSLFSIDDETGRIPEIDSNVYISEGNDFWTYIESKQESIIPEEYKQEHTPWQKNYFNTELTGALDGQISRYQRGDDVQSTREDGNQRIFGETQFMHDEYDFDKKGNKLGSGYDGQLETVSTIGEIEVHNNEQHLMQKVNDLFNSHQIGTLIGRFHTDIDENQESTLIQSAVSRFGLSRGRNLLKKNAWERGTAETNGGYSNPYCRVWTNHYQYASLKNAIRPFLTEDETPMNVYELQKDWKQFRTEHGASSLNTYGSLNRNGMVNITPTTGENTVETRNCMLSIENLAWKGLDPVGKILSPEQRGPNGGRIMWFPPYDLEFHENGNAEWESTTFIGRGEPVYTYKNTTRTGTLSFSIIVDNPSVLNYWMKSKKNTNKLSGEEKENSEQEALRFFAGCEPMNPEDAGNITTQKNENGSGEKKLQDVIPDKDITFYVFFPNNYSGEDDWTKAIDVIYGGQGTGETECTITSLDGGENGQVMLGYEMGTNPISTEFGYVSTPADDYMLHSIQTIDSFETYKKYKEESEYPEKVITADEYSSLFDKTIDPSDYGKEGTDDEVNTAIADIFTKLDDASDYVTKPIYYDGTTVYTGDNAYAQFYAEHHTLSTVNVKDSFSVDDAAGYYALLENSNELLIKAIRKNGDIEYYVRKLVPNIVIPEFDTKREFNKVSFSGSLKLGKIKGLKEQYVIDNNGVVTYYQTREELLKEIVLPTYSTTTEFAFSTKKDGWARVGGAIWTLQFEKVTDELNALVNFITDNCDEEYALEHLFSSDLWEVNFSYGIASFYCDFTINNEARYDTIQDFVISSNLPQDETKNIETANGSVKQNNETDANDWITLTGTLNKDAAADINYKYPFDRSKANEILKKDNFNYCDTKSFGYNSTYEAVKLKKPDATHSFGEFWAGMNTRSNDDKMVKFVLDCEKAILLRMGKSEDEIPALISEAETRIDEIRTALSNNNDAGRFNGYITAIDIEGGSSVHGTTAKNYSLAKQRAYTMNSMLKSFPALNRSGITTLMGHYDIPVDDNSVSGENAKLGRYGKATIVLGERDNLNAPTNADATESSASTTVQSSTAEYQRYDNERLFFEMLPIENKVAYQQLVDKVRYFTPAFHSMTPEGFNARLTFLQQCLRQGPTATSSDSMSNTASNLAFGRAPFCILRIGDYINTKIVIKSLDITYTDNLWDLNPEGIGLQPMLAKVSLTIEILGGSDITGPINRLQNAVSFNYYANTSVYDDRSDYHKGNTEVHWNHWQS